MKITDKLRAVLGHYAQIQSPTPQQDAAFDLLWKWLWLSATVYGHTNCLHDFRVQGARSRYALARRLKLAA